MVGLDCGELPWVVASWLEPLLIFHSVSLAGLTVTLLMFTVSPREFFEGMLLDAWLVMLLLLSSLRKTPARNPSPEGRCRVARPWKIQMI